MNRLFLCCAIVFFACSARAQFSGPAADSGAVDLSDPKYVLLDLKGAYRGQQLGLSMLPLGDCNHDGYNDFCVTHGFGNKQYRTDVYLGGKNPSSTPYQTLINGKATASGDLNNDGRMDLVTWVTYEITDSLWRTVALRIYFGTDTGFDTTHYVELADSVDFYFGIQTSISDIDNDGKNELLVLSGRRQSVYIYKFADTGLVREPWFVWSAPYVEHIYGGGPYLGVADLNNDSVLDIYYWDMSNNGSAHFRMFILWGQKAEYPQTDSMLHYESENLFRANRDGIASGNIFENNLNNLSLFVSDFDKRAKIFPIAKKRIEIPFLDTENAEYTLLSPSDVDATLPYSFEGDAVLVGNVNGGGESSIASLVSAYSGPGTTAYTYCIYSAGHALNSRFDGALEVSESTEDGPGTPVDIGDIDGDSLHEVALPDLNYERATGRVMIIRGSRDIPHKPVRVEVGLSRVPNSPEFLETYPNPFTNRTTLRFTVSNDPGATLSICDELGRTLIAHSHFSRGPGVYELRLNTESWSAGSYVCRLVERNKVKTIIIHHIH